MTRELRLHSLEDIPALVDLYNQSFLFAKKVGDLDWIYPFPEEFLATYIDQQELHGLMGTTGEIQSSVRLYESSDRSDTLFVGRLAVSGTVRGTNFTRDRFLPAIVDRARGLSKQQLSLTCLAYNTSLTQFYLALGFQEIDERPGRADAGYEVVVKEMSLML